jgi:hypothetical protein
LINRAFTYLGIITLCLYGLRYCHWQNLLSQKTGYYAKYRKAFFEKNDYNVLFLGSSRCAMHYNTGLFDTLTGCNSFNLSLSGATPRVSLAVLKAYLENSKAPEYILFETDLHNVDVDGEIMEFNNYFPFLRNRTLLTEFSEIDPRMKHFYYNAFYSWPYTGYKNISTGIRARLGLECAWENSEYKGFIMADPRPPLDFMPAHPKKGGYSVLNEKYARELIAFCKKEKIQLIFVTSTMFAGGKLDLGNKDQIVKQVDQIVTESGLPHWNLSSSPYCDQRKLFYDHFHMTYEGSRLFTLKLAGLFGNNCQKNPLKP